MYTFDENIVSDLHKDARGFRPSEYFWEEWSQCGDDTRQAMWDSLCQELEDNMAAEREAEAVALEKFAQLIINNINLGAGSVETAIRWMLEAEELTKFDLAYGADYVAWHFGLAYGNPYKERIAAVIRQMEDVQ